MTDDQIIETAIQGHASTRDAIRWAIEQVRRPPPLFDRQIDVVTVQQWGWDVDFAAHRAYARAIERLLNKPSADGCPDCGGPTRLNHGYVCNIETNWLACTECDWQGAPE
jgi:hypothetical protein